MLTIIISTWEKGVLGLEKTVQFIHPDVSYLIVHQTQKQEYKPDFITNRPDIRVISSPTKGISVSRNIGLKHCKTKYAILADDDVTYNEEGINHFLESITLYQPDFALYKIQTLAGEPEYKEYPKKEYQVSNLKHWVSSIEIAVNVEKLKTHHIKFDERFGLGTSLNRGEEEVFIHDLIANNFTGIYFPVYLVIHPYMSSGKHKRTIEEYWFVKGALDERMRKVISPDSIREKLNYNDDEVVIATQYYNKGRAEINNVSIPLDSKVSLPTT